MINYVTALQLYKEAPPAGLEPTQPDLKFRRSSLKLRKQLGGEPPRLQIITIKKEL